MPSNVARSPGFSRFWVRPTAMMRTAVLALDARRSRLKNPEDATTANYEVVFRLRLRELGLNPPETDGKRCAPGLCGLNMPGSSELHGGIISTLLTKS